MAANKKLWQIDGGLHPLVEAYTVGEDYLLDQCLIPYDITASRAHAEMLQHIGVLTAKELETLHKAFNTLQAEWKKGTFKVRQDQEDGHTAIEQYLVEACGDLGKKIHTARSRNDQAMVMMRLFERDQLAVIGKLLDETSAAFRQAAAKHKAQQMPGYTHMQRAMPTTVGVWLDSFADGFADSKLAVAAAAQLIDQNPLGSASGFGIANFQVDKNITTEKMGFAKIQDNPMYCGLSRGIFETMVLGAMTMPMLLASRFATDMLLFTTEEYSFFSLPKEYTTGSSIMPNKQNYDLFEIMRGNFNVHAAYLQQVQQIAGVLPSGYARDLQLTKAPIVKGLELVQSTLALLAEVAPKLQANSKSLDFAMSPDLFATERVYQLVKSGVLFRDAYAQVKKELQDTKD
ncbi:MAG TPA: lyase family protein [Patescibacteria group bacterium]|jgi:argininosuccinate lyase|nr:lyase family protein [Patescibacteria group bacterium]